MQSPSFREPVRHLLGLAMIATGACHAGEVDVASPNAHLRYVAVGWQGDAVHNRSMLGLLSLPVQDRAWLQFGGGRDRQATNDGTRNVDAGSLGVGYLGDGWLVSLTASHRRAGDRLRQTDWDGVLEGQGERFGLGLDLHHRDARQDSSAAASSPLSGTVDVPVRQQVRGSGLGLHAHVQLNDRLRAYGSLMRYDYRVSTQRMDEAAGGPMLLSTLLSSNPSFVSRAELPLRNSTRLGATYRFDAVSLSAEAVVDRVKDDPGTVRTCLLKAAFDLGERWTLTPSIGSTRSGQGKVGFGGLVANRAW